MAETEEKESLPANIYNYTYRILGYDYRKVLGLIVTVILASVAIRIDLLLFAAVLSLGTVLSLWTIDGMTPILYIFSRLRLFGRRKYGIIQLAYRILANDGGIIIGDGINIYQFIRVDEATPPEKALNSAKGFTEAIARIISHIESDLDFIFFPVSADVLLYRIDGNSADSEDYNRLLDYVFEDCHYLQSFIILKRQRRSEKEAIDSALMKEEANNLVSLLNSSGISCSIVSSAGELEEIMEVFL